MRKYDGEMAENYDKKRINNSAWPWQQKTVEDILRRYRPVSLMDIPVGTGRFFDVYKEIGCQVVGIDISGDMLKEARKKNEMDYPLIQASGFDVEWWPFVVSTRFFGHLNDTLKRQMLAKVTGRLLVSHRPADYDYFRNMNIIETHQMEDGTHCVSLIETSRTVRA